MIKNIIISILIVCLLQWIWIPETSTIHKAISNVGFTIVICYLLTEIERRGKQWIKQQQK